MSRTPIAMAWTKTWECGSAAVLAACFAASVAAADPPIAAPGDCSQPYHDLDTGPVPPSASSGGVAGPASSHFAPVSATQNVAAHLTGDLTGIKLQVAPKTSSGLTGLVSSIGGALGLVGESTVDAVQTDGQMLVNEVGDAGGTLVITTEEATGSLLGSAEDAGTALLGESVDSPLAGAGDAGASAIEGATDAGATLVNGLGDASGSLVQDAGGSLLQNTSDALITTTGGLLR
jgi:hypothetical protein